MKVHFEPERIIVVGTITITDNEDEIINEYEETFAYKWNEFNEIIDLKSYL